MAETLRIRTEKDAFSGHTLATVLLESVTQYDHTPLEHDLKQALSGAGNRLAVDLSAVQVMGSAGLGLLINLQKQARDAKGKLVLFALREDLHEQMRITRLTSMFTIVKDRGAAIKALS